MSDKALLEMIGQFIKETRLQRNKTQQELAATSGIARSTLVQTEKGGGSTLLSFIQIMRSLEQLHLFGYFEIKKQISPLELAKMEKAKRQRARRKKNNNQKKESDL
ncbi:MAG TPA: helix-turn-helix transcriptional regulator [Chitinophagaceae bacterium]|nr:helix-turn-helix transcriptional regulator [Chitinophagaceae bacterium]